ncbi:hypothetical protein DY000_02036566 [Brassica cretica]|uniref:NADH dehydrogenase [ubiquinone] 1 beta subcomplex subunit 9 n=1 Tax=Brassica cretica TaxID=69181 RepID=A0ABQ7BCE4_BRACR|nr:hypothetical protein DY000_02036566 [Brassica cretica]
MSGVSSAAYFARRAAQKERVRILYRRTLKDTLNWAVHRHIFYRDASDLREKFNANQDVEDVDRIDKLIAHGESEYDKWRHPDPYIVPWAPGGSKFCRNPTPPAGVIFLLNTYHVLKFLSSCVADADRDCVQLRSRRQPLILTFHIFPYPSIKLKHPGVAYVSEDLLKTFKVDQL